MLFYAESVSLKFKCHVDHRAKVLGCSVPILHIMLRWKSQWWTFRVDILMYCLGTVLTKYQLYFYDLLTIIASSFFNCIQNIYLKAKTRMTWVILTKGHTVQSTCILEFLGGHLNVNSPYRVKTHVLPKNWSSNKRSATSVQWLSKANKRHIYI